MDNKEHKGEAVMLTNTSCEKVYYSKIEGDMSTLSMDGKLNLKMDSLMRLC